MISRENTVLLVTTVATMGGLYALSRAGLGELVVPGFVLVVGVGVLAPQLYLARTDDELPALSRMRAAAVVTFVLSLGFSNYATGAERLAVLAVGAAPLVPLLGYEALAGYRDARPDPAGE